MWKDLVRGLTGSEVEGSGNFSGFLGVVKGLRLHERPRVWSPLFRLSGCRGLRLRRTEGSRVQGSWFLEVVLNRSPWFYDRPALLADLKRDPKLNCGPWGMCLQRASGMLLTFCP